MKKKLGYASLVIMATFCFIIIACNFAIEMASKGKTYDNIEEIPKNKVGMVLGTSNRLIGGTSNPYYTNRINATIVLFKAGKIDYVLVSGDNGTPYYNEPINFKKDLIKGGIPENRIFLDYAGFRTLDSVVRAKLVFGLEHVTIISQNFHNKRAIYLAEKKGLKAIGFNAKNLPIKQGLKVEVREYFARVKVFIDLALNTQPKYYGEHISIE